MALPFIVGPHQCSLTHGPEGYPQVEVTFRLRLPIAEFIDAMLLSLAEPRPLAQRAGKGAESGSTSPPAKVSHSSGRKGESKGAESRGDAPRAVKAGGTETQAQKGGHYAPRIPNRYSKPALDVDPTHAKLLATLSSAAAMPDVTAQTSSAQQVPDRATSSSGANHGATTLTKDTPPGSTTN